jgi:hypothetical protein
MAAVIRTNAAAAMLGVSSNTLRSWERRFGFPKPARTSGGHRQFDLGEIEALRTAFDETQNVSSAVAIAQERGAGPASPARLRSAFSRYDEVEADRVLGESLTVRSVERTIEEVLLPGVEATGSGPACPEYAFAWRLATSWMCATARLSPPASRSEAVVVFDASAPQSLDALHAQALELVLRRSGLRALTLRAELDQARLTHALTAVDPRAVVFAGEGAELDALSRLVYAARRVAGDRSVIFNYRGALPDSGASTVPALVDSPMAARDQLLAGLTHSDRAAEQRFAKRAAAAV